MNYYQFKNLKTIQYNKVIASFVTKTSSTAQNIYSSRHFFTHIVRICMSLPSHKVVEHHALLSLLFTTKFSPILIGLNWSRDAIVFTGGETLFKQ